MYVNQPLHDRLVSRRIYRATPTDISNSSMAHNQMRRSQALYRHTRTQLTMSNKLFEIITRGNLNHYSAQLRNKAGKVTQKLELHT